MPTITHTCVFWLLFGGRSRCSSGPCGIKALFDHFLPFQNSCHPRCNTSNSVRACGQEYICTVHTSMHAPAVQQDHGYAAAMHVQIQPWPQKTDLGDASRAPLAALQACCPLFLVRQLTTYCTARAHLSIQPSCFHLHIHMH